MSLAKIEIGLREGAPTETLQVAADAEGTHLVTTASTVGLSVMACPSGDVLAFVPWTALAYVLTTETSEHEHDAPEAAPASLAKGDRVTHADHGSGRVVTGEIDADGEIYVAFDKGTSGYVAATDLTKEAGS